MFCRDSEALQAFAQDAYQCSLAYGPLDVRTSLAYYNLAKVFQGMNEMDKSLMYCDQVCMMLHIIYTEQSTPSQIMAVCACQYACILRSFSFIGMSLLSKALTVTKLTTLGIDCYTRHAGMICLCRYGHHANTMINRVD